MKGKSSKILAIFLSFCLLSQQLGFAQVALQLNLSRFLYQLSPVDKFRPLHMRYFSFDPGVNKFDLLLDKGDLKKISDEELRSQGQELFKYFLVGLTLPNKTFWVNLRPDSEERIIDPALEKTDVGKILLEADLQLKKDTALYTSPENPQGKEYWDRLYKKAAEIFGTENITIPTLTRPWIVPNEVIIRYNGSSAYVYKATLKVMLEQDYLKDSSTYNFNDPRMKELNEYASQQVRELIIPLLNKEINQSKRYAQLRQVFYSLILAQWFKQECNNSNSAYCRMIDRYKLNELASQESWSKDTYFQAYKKSFEQGEYNIKTPSFGAYGQNIRSYFSGGMNLDGAGVVKSQVSSPLFGIQAAALNPQALGGAVLTVTDGKVAVASSPTKRDTSKHLPLDPVIKSAELIANGPIRLLDVNPGRKSTKKPSGLSPAIQAAMAKERPGPGRVSVSSPLNRDVVGRILDEHGPILDKVSNAIPELMPELKGTTLAMRSWATEIAFNHILFPDKPLKFSGILADFAKYADNLLQITKYAIDGIVPGWDGLQVKFPLRASVQQELYGNGKRELVLKDIAVTVLRVSPDSAAGTRERIAELVFTHLVTPNDSLVFKGGLVYFAQYRDDLFESGRNALNKWVPGWSEGASSPAEINELTNKYGDNKPHDMMEVKDTEGLTLEEFAGILAHWQNDPKLTLSLFWSDRTFFLVQRQSPKNWRVLNDAELDALKNEYLGKLQQGSSAQNRKASSPIVVEIGLDAQGRLPVYPLELADKLIPGNVAALSIITEGPKNRREIKAIKQVGIDIYTSSNPESTFLPVPGPEAAQAVAVPRLGALSAAIRDVNLANRLKDTIEIVFVKNLGENIYVRNFSANQKNPTSIRIFLDLNLMKNRKTLSPALEAALKHIESAASSPARTNLLIQAPSNMFIRGKLLALMPERTFLKDDAFDVANEIQDVLNKRPSPVVKEELGLKMREVLREIVLKQGYTGEIPISSVDIEASLVTLTGEANAGIDNIILVTRQLETDIRKLKEKLSPTGNELGGAYRNVLTAIVRSELAKEGIASSPANSERDIPILADYLIERGVGINALEALLAKLKDGALTYTEDPDFKEAVVARIIADTDKDLISDLLYCASLLGLSRQYGSIPQMAQDGILEKIINSMRAKLNTAFSPTTMPTEEKIKQVAISLTNAGMKKTNILDIINTLALSSPQSARRVRDVDSPKLITEDAARKSTAVKDFIAKNALLDLGYTNDFNGLKQAYLDGVLIKINQQVEESASSPLARARQIDGGSGLAADERRIAGSSPATKSSSPVEVEEISLAVYGRQKAYPPTLDAKIAAKRFDAYSYAEDPRAKKAYLIIDSAEVDNEPSRAHLNLSMNAKDTLIALPLTYREQLHYNNPIGATLVVVEGLGKTMFKRKVYDRKRDLIFVDVRLLSDQAEFVENVRAALEALEKARARTASSPANQSYNPARVEEIAAAYKHGSYPVKVKEIAATYKHGSYPADLNKLLLNGFAAYDYAHIGLQPTAITVNNVTRQGSLQIAKKQNDSLYHLLWQQHIKEESSLKEGQITFVVVKGLGTTLFKLEAYPFNDLIFIDLALLNDKALLGANLIAALDALEKARARAASSPTTVNDEIRNAVQDPYMYTFSRKLTFAYAPNNNVFRSKEGRQNAKQHAAEVLKKIEENVLTVVFGKDFEGGKQVVKRGSADANLGWTDMLREKHPEGVKFLVAQVELTQTGIPALMRGDYETYNRCLNEYARTRTNTSRAWLALMLRARKGEKGLPLWVYERLKVMQDNPNEYGNFLTLFDLIDHGQAPVDYDLYAPGDIGKAMEAAAAFNRIKEYEAVGLFALGAGGAGTVNAFSVAPRGGQPARELAQEFLKFLAGKYQMKVPQMITPEQKQAGVEGFSTDQLEDLVAGRGEYATGKHTLAFWVAAKADLDGVIFTGLDEWNQAPVLTQRGLKLQTPADLPWVLVNKNTLEILPIEQVVDAQGNVRSEYSEKEWMVAKSWDLSFDWKTYFRVERSLLSDENIKLINGKIKLNGFQGVFPELWQWARANGKKIYISAPARWLDTLGSSWDLKDFRLEGTPEGDIRLNILPSCNAIPSEYRLEIEISTIADSHVVEYAAPQYFEGVHRVNPNKVELLSDLNQRPGDVESILFVKHPIPAQADRGIQMLKRKEKDLPAVFARLFGIPGGIRFTCKKMSAVPRQGGMESSNIFTDSVAAIFNMLSGANFSVAEISHISLMAQINEANNITGNQGADAAWAGAGLHVYLGGMRDRTAPRNFAAVETKFFPRQVDFKYDSFHPKWGITEYTVPFYQQQIRLTAAELKPLGRAVEKLPRAIKKMLEDYTLIILPATQNKIVHYSLGRPQIEISITLLQEGREDELALRLSQAVTAKELTTRIIRSNLGLSGEFNRTLRDTKKRETTLVNIGGQDITLYQVVNNVSAMANEMVAKRGLDMGDLIINEHLMQLGTQQELAPIRFSLISRLRGNVSEGLFENEYGDQINKAATRIYLTMVALRGTDLSNAQVKVKLSDIDQIFAPIENDVKVFMSGELPIGAVPAASSPVEVETVERGSGPDDAFWAYPKELSDAFKSRGSLAAFSGQIGQSQKPVSRITYFYYTLRPMESVPIRSSAQLVVSSTQLSTLLSVSKKLNLSKRLSYNSGIVFVRGLTKVYVGCALAGDPTSSDIFLNADYLDNEAGLEEALKAALKHIESAASSPAMTRREFLAASATLAASALGLPAQEPTPERKAGLNDHYGDTGNQNFASHFQLVKINLAEHRTDSLVIQFSEQEDLRAFAVSLSGPDYRGYKFPYVLNFQRTPQGGYSLIKGKFGYERVDQASTAKVVAAEIRMLDGKIRSGWRLIIPIKEVLGYSDRDLDGKELKLTTVTQVHFHHGYQQYDGRLNPKNIELISVPMVFVAKSGASSPARTPQTIDDFADGKVHGIDEAARKLRYSLDKFVLGLSMVESDPWLLLSIDYEKRTFVIKREKVASVKAIPADGSGNTPDYKGRAKHILDKLNHSTEKANGSTVNKQGKPAAFSLAMTKTREGAIKGFKWVAYQEHGSSGTAEALARIGLVLLNSGGRGEHERFFSEIYRTSNNDSEQMAAFLGLLLLKPEEYKNSFPSIEDPGTSETAEDLFQAGKEFVKSEGDIQKLEAAIARIRPSAANDIEPLTKLIGELSEIASSPAKTSQTIWNFADGKEHNISEAAKQLGLHLNELVVTLLEAGYQGWNDVNFNTEKGTFTFTKRKGGGQHPALDYEGIRRDAAQIVAKLGVAASSPVDKGKDVGGIDFRYINMVTQAQMMKAQANFRMPDLQVLKNLNLVKEGVELKKLMAAGIMPSQDRVIQFVSASRLRSGGEDEALVFVVDYLKLQEEANVETGPEFKVFLTVIDSEKVAG